MGRASTTSGPAVTIACKVVQQGSDWVDNGEWFS
jgi:hypothetical protein